MKSSSKSSSIPDKNLAAVCGLFCPSCSAYIGAHEDPARLEGMAKRLGQPVDKLQCNGCRSEKRSFYCESLCKMYKCAADKGIDFCGQCEEYPCSDLKAFQANVPHRLELWKSQERIKEAGYEKWYEEMARALFLPSLRHYQFRLRHGLLEMRGISQLCFCESA